MQLRSLLALCLALSLLHRSHSHGLLFDPPQRGILPGNHFTPHLKPISGAPYDPYAHFPAGDKHVRPGAGLRSQEKEGSFNWTPFTPLLSSFRWRAGVCGDLKGSPAAGEHLRGGKYYYGGTVTRTFRVGGILRARVSIVAHHNGFLEFHVCDVAKCGGEISAACFRRGFCYALRRVRNKSCESRTDPMCAPIDPKYPGRWYLPCSAGGKFDVYDKIMYRLPRGLRCEHCVLHWFWSAANTCNPPGVREYFEGNRGPKWRPCPGQGGAIGGYTKVQRDCGGKLFPEEYYQCADIRIGGKRNGKQSRTSAVSNVYKGKRSVNGNDREGGSDNGGDSNVDLDEEEEVDDDDEEEEIDDNDEEGEEVDSDDDAKEELDDKDENEGDSGNDEEKEEVDDRTEGGKQEEKIDDKGNETKVVRYFVVVADGREVTKMEAGGRYTVDIDGAEWVTIEAVTQRQVKQMDFYIDGKMVWSEHHQPYFLMGNKGKAINYWDDAVIGRWFKLEISVDGPREGVLVLLRK